MAVPTAAVLMLYAAKAQIPGFHFQRVGPAQKLSQNVNEYIYRDSRGFVWISALNGLNRFDGLEVRYYGPNPNNPRALYGQIVNSNFFETSDGNIWFTANRALNRYNRRTDDFDHWQFPNPDMPGDTLLEDYQVFYLQEDSLLWLRVGLPEAGNLYRFNIQTQRANRIGPLNGNRFFAFAENGNPAIEIFSFFYGRNNSHNPLLYKTSWAPEKPIVRDSLFYDKTEFSDLTFQDLIVAKDSVWAATNKGLLGFLKYQKPLRFRLDIVAPNSRLNSIARLNERTFAVSSDNAGLLFYDWRLGAITAQFRRSIETLASISSDDLKKIYIDKDGILWISDWGNGVNYLNLHKARVQNIIFNTLPVQAQNASSIRTLAEDKQGNIWCGTSSRGALVFGKNGSFTQIYGTRNLPKLTIYQFFCARDGTLFAFTKDGIYWKKNYEYAFSLVEGSKNILFNFPPPVFQSTDGRIFFHYFQFYELLATLDGKGFQIIPSKAYPGLQAYNPTMITFIHPTKEGELYVNLNDNQTIIVHPSGKLDTLEGIINLTGAWESPDGLHIWLSTKQGLAQVHKQSKKTRLFNQADGLPTDYLLGLSADSKGFLWLASNVGILRFNLRTETVTQHILPADGLWDYEIRENAWLCASDGRIWAGNRDVLNILDPAQFSVLKTPPSIQILEWTVNGERRQSIPYIGECQELIMQPHENSLSFKFTALEYSDSDNNQLHYHLDNYDPKGLWVAVERGSYGNARYSKLPPGKYRLRIKATNSDGMAPVIKTLGITIKRPFYRTWWFFLLVGLLVVTVILTIIAIRERQLKEKLLLEQRTTDSEMKALRAQMNPHFIFNLLNSINALILKGKKEDAASSIETFADLMRKILNHSSSEVIPLEQELEFLEKYLQAEKIRMKERLEWEFFVDEDLETFDVQVPTMILQPFIENAIKHGLSPKPQGGKVDIHIRQIPQGLECAIRDNGVGIEYSRNKLRLNPQNHESHGEKITRERLSLYDHKYKTASAIRIAELKDELGNPCGTEAVVTIGL